MSSMTSQLFILTGASRGMGLAMAQQLLAAGHSLLCISRTESATLAQPATSAQPGGASLQQWSHDLADSNALAPRLQNWLKQQASTAWGGVTLINNAGMIGHISPLSDATAADLAQALRVGLEAPLLLTAAFLQATQDWPAERKVLCISSGLGRKPMASQAAYCAAKAGMDHFMRCLALEEAQKPRGAKVCSLAPGVIDTAMQLHLRSASAKDFPDQENFAQLASSGQLTSPAAAAARVLAYLARPDFGTQPVADVRS